MIVVRNVFQLHFGKAKEATALWKEGLVIAKRMSKGSGSQRLLTDLVGEPYYTMIFETTHESLSEFEASSKAIMSDPEWQAWYPKFAAHCAGGHREILNVVA